MISLDKKLTHLPRIGGKYAELLKRMRIETIRDFLFHFPFRYEDYSERIQIDELTAGQTATVMGQITHSKLIRTWKKKMMIVEATVQDESASVRCVWFNQPYISDSLIEGKGIRISGKVSSDSKGLYFSNPAWEFSSREPTNTGRLVPIYPETEGITSKWIRWQLATIFKKELSIEDPIPEHILEELHLPKLQTALQYIHFPQTENQYLLAQKRFAFQNMLTVQLTALQMKMEWQEEKAVPIKINNKVITDFFNNLPFSLTNAQKKACEEIFNDLGHSMPMNRLLNGDVGSGKTIVAASACNIVAHAGFQSAIMAPTEVLARQHFDGISKLLSPFGISVSLLTNAYQLVKETSEIKKYKREDLLKIIHDGKTAVVIGTHALIQKDVSFNNLALIVVDEQHRFGVQQRAFLQQEARNSNDGIKDKVPHLLTMTATPIPRTLALAFFGNLDISVLNEMPKNRKTIKTEIISHSNRNHIYEFVQKEIAAGRQAFVILPLVEESKALSELKAAVTEHKRLSKEVFPNLSLGLLHGKLKSSEKEEIMKDFKDKKYDILVATSVVEVGIDVPNATVIIIEDADRFGLSQLHQFRGRVGRGEHQSYCFLFTSSNTQKAKQRLGALVKSSDGFSLAEEDLKLRGPGEFLGTRQSGIPDIAMQHIANVKLIEISKRIAQDLLKNDKNLKKFPLLKKELERFNSVVHLE